MSAQPASQQIEFRDVEDVTVVRFIQRVIGDPDIEFIGAELRRLVDEQGRRKLILDFGNVEFLNSRDLGQLIALNKKLKARDGWLTLSNANLQILGVLRTMNLTKFFDIREERSEAPAPVQQSS